MKIIKIRSPYHFDVRGDSGQIYLVNILKDHCTCMDWVMQTARLKPSEVEDYKPTYQCKHIRWIIAKVEKYGHNLESLVI